MASAARDIGIEIAARGGSVVVRVLGDLDLRTAPEMRIAVLAALERPGLESVVVELSAVRHMDNSGARSLLEAWQAAQERKARFILTGVREGPRRALGIMPRPAGPATAAPASV